MDNKNENVSFVVVQRDISDNDASESDEGDYALLDAKENDTFTSELHPDLIPDDLKFARPCKLCGDFSIPWES